jgi:hypothetical protein
LCNVHETLCSWCRCSIQEQLKHQPRVHHAVAMTTVTLTLTLNHPESPAHFLFPASPLRTPPITRHSDQRKSATATAASWSHEHPCCCHNNNQQSGHPAQAKPSCTWNLTATTLQPQHMVNLRHRVPPDRHLCFHVNRRPASAHSRP